MYALRNRVRWPEGVLPTGQFAPWLVERQHPVYLIVNESERGWLEGLAKPRGATVEKLSRRYYGALLPVGFVSERPHSAQLPLTADAGTGIREPSAR